MRVKKVSPAGETRYLYDASAVVMEYGGAAQSFASQRKYDTATACSLSPRSRAQRAAASSTWWMA